MTLVKARDLLDQAAQAHIGVAAFNVITLEHAEAIAAGAQAAPAPAILQAMAPNLGRRACEALLDADTLVAALSRVATSKVARPTTTRPAAPRLAGSRGGPAC